MSFNFLDKLKRVIHDLHLQAIKKLESSVVRNGKVESYNILTG
jgi:hypothetical protein